MELNRAGRSFSLKVRGNVSETKGRHFERGWVGLGVNGHLFIPCEIPGEALSRLKFSRI